MMRNLYLNVIKETEFPGASNFLLHGPDEEVKVPCFFNKINNVNIFVGENNSGKSRFLRGIMQQQEFLFSNVTNANEKIENLLLLANEFSTKVTEARIEGLIIQIPSAVNLDEFAAVNNILNKLPEKGILSNSNTIRLEDKYPQVVSMLKNISKIFFNNGSDVEIDALRRNIVSNRSNKEIANDLLLNIIIIYLVADSCDNSGSGNSYSFYGQTVELSRKIKKLAYELVFSGFEVETPPLIYIPILRSARNLYTNIYSEDGIAKRLTDLYVNTIVIDYKVDANKVSIETGLDLYKKIKRTRNQVREIRRGFELFESFLSKTFFGGKELEIVAKDADNIHGEHLSVLIDDSDRDIHLLGDGVQSLIILLYPIFMAKEGSYIFIEEPELNMHPGMQRIFMNALLEDKYIKSKNLTVFMTTHSNHLLNTSFDFKSQVNILLFNKAKDENGAFHKVSISHSRDLAILDNIGVINSSVFLSNCSIWVEGITDRKYIRQYIECFLKENFSGLSIKEDIHYSFLEYAGSNISHYLFSSEDESKAFSGLINGLGISNRILLIADLDKGKEKKHESLGRQVSNQFSYYPLPVLEIENLLSSVVVKKSLPELLNIASAKIESIQINDTELSQIGIGGYLKIKLHDIGVTVSDTFKAESGTIGTYYKNKLADICTKHITWNNMSPASKALAEYVFAFIIKQNRGGVVDYDFAGINNFSPIEK